MALLLRIFLLFTILCTGYSFKCYRCNSEKLNGCAKDAKPQEHDCGTVISINKFYCVYITSHDIAKNITYTNSSCFDTFKETPLNKIVIPQCEYAPKGIIRIVECRICPKELCNFATLPNASLLAYVPLILLLSFFLR